MPRMDGWLAVKWKIRLLSSHPRGGIINSRLGPSVACPIFFTFFIPATILLQPSPQGSSFFFFLFRWLLCVFVFLFPFLLSFFLSLFFFFLIERAVSFSRKIIFRGNDLRHAYRSRRRWMITLRINPFRQCASTHISSRSSFDTTVFSLSFPRSF